MDKKNKRNHRRFMRFLVVGVVNTGLDFLLFNILLLITRQAGWGSWQVNICNTISASTVALMSYELNNRFVFTSDKKLPAHYRLYFVLITLSGIFIIQNGIIKLIVPNAGPIVSLSNSILSVMGLKLADNFISNNFAKACATLATLIWNYNLTKKYIFKPDN